MLFGLAGVFDPLALYEIDAMAFLILPISVGVDPLDFSGFGWRRRDESRKRSVANRGVALISSTSYSVTLSNKAAYSSSELESSWQAFLLVLDWFIIFLLLSASVFWRHKIFKKIN